MSKEKTPEQALWNVAQTIARQRGGYEYEPNISINQWMASGMVMRLPEALSHLFTVPTSRNDGKPPFVSVEQWCHSRNKPRTEGQLGAITIAATRQSNRTSLAYAFWESAGEITIARSLSVTPCSEADVRDPAYITRLIRDREVRERMEQELGFDKPQLEEITAVKAILSPPYVKY